MNRPSHVHGLHVASYFANLTVGPGDPGGPLARERMRSCETNDEVRRRASAIFGERCQGLFATADHTVLLVLPLQWFIAMLLSAFQPQSSPAGLCTAGLGGRLDVQPYLFVALALLAFYRDWRLIVLLALLALGVDSTYGTLVCGTPGAARFFEHSLGLYAWVILEGCALGLVCSRSMLMFRAGAAESAESGSVRPRSDAGVFAMHRSMTREERS